MHRNIRQHFCDPVFEPDPTSPLRELVLERRRIALSYWVWKPQIERIEAMIPVTGFALVLHKFEPIFGVAIPDRVSFELLLLTIVASEAVMFQWRSERDDAPEQLELRRVRHIVAAVEYPGPGHAHLPLPRNRRARGQIGGNHIRRCVFPEHVGHCRPLRGSSP